MGVITLGENCFIETPSARIVNIHENLNVLNAYHVSPISDFNVTWKQPIYVNLEKQPRYQRWFYAILAAIAFNAVLGIFLAGYLIYRRRKETSSNRTFAHPSHNNSAWRKRLSLFRRKPDDNPQTAFDDRPTDEPRNGKI